MAATLQADKLLRELANVWEDLGKQGVEDKSGGVLRACAMNLLVCVQGGVDVGETIAGLVHEFPSRVIVLRVRKTSTPTLEGRALAHKVIVDSRDAEDPEWTIARLKEMQDRGHAVGDLAWARVTRWRESVAQMFDHPACAAKAEAIESITVTHASLSTPTTSRYLAEWVASSLGRDVPISYQSLRQTRAWNIHSLELRGEGFVATIVRKDANQVEIRWDCYTSALAFPKLTPSTLLLEEFEVLDRDPIFERVLKRL